MTPIYIALFILGVAIGLLISYVTVAKRMGKSLDRVFEQELGTYKFVKEWAEITNKQYKEYSDYTSKVIDLLKQEVDILIKDDQLLTETFKEMATAVDSSIKARFDAFTANRLDVYDVLREDIDSMQTTSDNRWKIIQDSWAEVDQYMTNRVRKPDFKDFLYWLNWHHGVQVMAWNVPELASMRVTMYYHRAADRPLVVSRMFDTEDLSTHMESILESMFDELFKEAENYEHENREEEAGAPEGGDAGHQEAEQDAVLSGEADGKLVQSELAEDRLGDSSEAEEGQGLDVSVLRAAVDAKLFSMDAAYDYDQH